MVTASLAMVKAVEPVTSPVWAALVTNPLYWVLVALSPVFTPDTEASNGTVNVLPSVIVKVAPVAGAVIASLLTEVALAAPRVGVISVGEVANTATPVPVSSLNAPASPAELVSTACLPLKVVQSAALNTPLFEAEAVGIFKVITGVVVPVATEEVTSVPVVPSVKAATEVTVPVVGVVHVGIPAAAEVNTCPEVPAAV